jgi:hypothetical protein
MPLLISQKLLDAASSLNTAVATPAVFGSLGCQRTVHHVKWGTGVTAGAVTIEVAEDPSYTGTWAPVMVVTFSGTAPKQDYVADSNGPYGAIRHRVSTAVSNGTVTTTIKGED